MEVVKKASYEALDKGVTTIKAFDIGNYLQAFIIAGIMCLVSIALIWMVKPLKNS
jgi:hypothetical protein